jgi:hypothetical protein
MLFFFLILFFTLLGNFSVVLQSCVKGLFREARVVFHLNCKIRTETGHFVPVHLLLTYNLWNVNMPGKHLWLFFFFDFFSILVSLAFSICRSFFSFTIILKETISDTLFLLQDLVDHELMLTRGMLEENLRFSSSVMMCRIIVIILDLFLGKHNLSNVDSCCLSLLLKMINKSRELILQILRFIDPILEVVELVLLRIGVLLFLLILSFFSPLVLFVLFNNDALLDGFLLLLLLGLGDLRVVQQPSCKIVYRVPWLSLKGDSHSLSDDETNVIRHQGLSLETVLFFHM